MIENIRKQAPWQMMFVDEMVVRAREKAVLELELDHCREALENRVKKVPRAKTVHV